MSWYDAIPKVEIHVHLEGAIPHDSLWELIQKYGGDAEVPDLRALQRRFEYRNFSHFIRTWSWKNRFLREYEDFSFIAEATAADFAAQNIRYAEMFFSPSLFVRRGLEIQRIAEAVRLGLDRVRGTTVNLIADLVRDYGPKFEMRTLAGLREVQDRGVIGIGIGGSEMKFPPEPFEAIYRDARRMGFRTNAHAGEAAGAASIWGALEQLHAERIGHGTRASEDPALIDYLIESQIPLEMCPVSNVRTAVVDTVSHHPIRAFFDRGIVVTVNSDDPKMFDTSLANEYRALVEQCGFSQRDICELIRNAIESSWLSTDHKQVLREQFTSDSAWVSG